MTLETFRVDEDHIAINIDLTTCRPAIEALPEMIERAQLVGLICLLLDGYLKDDMEKLLVIMTAGENVKAKMEMMQEKTDD